MAFHRNQHGITEVRKALSNFHLVWLFSTSLQASVLAEGWANSYVLIRWDPKCFAFHRSFSGRTKSSLLVPHLTQFISGRHPQALFCLTAHPSQADQYLFTVVAHNLDPSSFQSVMSFSLTEPTLLSLDELDFSAFVLSPDFDATDYVQSTTMQFVNGFQPSSSYTVDPTIQPQFRHPLLQSDTYDFDKFGYETEDDLILPDEDQKLSPPLDT
jgi:hypothetical protein